MSENKEGLIKSILSIRRRQSSIQLGITREIDIFEEQINKALKRIDKVSYLSKKFNITELIETHKSYQQLIDPSARLEDIQDTF